jgi:hypothetical protein
MYSVFRFLFLLVEKVEDGGIVARELKAVIRSLVAILMSFSCNGVYILDFFLIH